MNSPVSEVLTKEERAAKTSAYGHALRAIILAARADGIWIKLDHGALSGEGESESSKIKKEYSMFPIPETKDNSLGAAAPMYSGLVLTTIWEEQDRADRDRHTELVPVWTPETAHLFVSEKVLPIRTIVHPDGRTIKTAPLLFGSHTFNLLSISQTDELLESGVLSATDYIDPVIRLKRVYFEAVLGNGGGSIVLAVDPSPSPYGDAVPAHYGESSNRLLQFDGSFYMPGKENIQYAGNLKDAHCAERLLSWFEGNSLTVDVKIHGSFNVQTAKSELYSNSPMWSVTQKTSPVFADIDPFFVEVKAIGYDLDSNRGNYSNRTPLKVKP